jgi:hypothetical protein
MKDHNLSEQEVDLIIDALKSHQTQLNILKGSCYVNPQLGRDNKVSGLTTYNHYIKLSQDLKLLESLKEKLSNENV